MQDEPLLPEVQTEARAALWQVRGEGAWASRLPAVRLHCAAPAVADRCSTPRVAGRTVLDRRSAARPCLRSRRCPGLSPG